MLLRLWVESPFPLSSVLFQRLSLFPDLPSFSDLCVAMIDPGLGPHCSHPRIIDRLGRLPINGLHYSTGCEMKRGPGQTQGYLSG